MADIHPLARNRHPAQADEFVAVQSQGHPLAGGSPLLQQGELDFQSSETTRAQPRLQAWAFLGGSAGCQVRHPSGFCEGCCFFGPSSPPLLSDDRAKYGRRVGQPSRVRTAANQECALDFVHDAVESGFSTSDAIGRSDVVA